MLVTPAVSRNVNNSYAYELMLNLLYNNFIIGPSEFGVNLNVSNWCSTNIHINN